MHSDDSCGDAFLEISMFDFLPTLHLISTFVVS
jgi:hypothetical protein